MRYDTPVYFQKIVRGEYDPSTGNYLPDTVEETEVKASVVSTSAETMRLVYSEIKQGSCTIHIQNKIDWIPFSRVRIGEKIYSIDIVRPLRVKQSFIVSEVQ